MEPFFFFQNGSLNFNNNAINPTDIVLSAGKNLSVAWLIKSDKENAMKAVNKTISYAQRNNAPQNVKQELEKLRQEIMGL